MISLDLVEQDGGSDGGTWADVEIGGRIHDGRGQMLGHHGAIVIVTICMPSVAHEIVDCGGEIVMLRQITDEFALSTATCLRVENHGYITFHFEYLLVLVGSFNMSLIAAFIISMLAFIG